jgi:hypothetical protein
MAREFDDLFDLQNLSDDEVREVILEQLRDQPSLAVDNIDVIVRQGAVTLTGRVGTDAEVSVAEAVLDDIIGIDNYSNELVVDELTREDPPMAADGGFDLDGEPIPFGDPSDQQSDTADHLVEDLAAETDGTDDMAKAIRDGAAYSPPDHPIGDGYGSRENH